MTNSTKTSLQAGIFYSIVGATVGVFIEPVDTLTAFWQLPVGASIGGFITMFGVWKLLLSWKNKYSVYRGILAGGISGVASHVVCWYLIILEMNICYWIFGGCKGSLGDPPIDPLNGLWGAFVFSFWSWIIVGWLTVILGVVIGGLLGNYQKRKYLVVHLGKE